MNFLASFLLSILSLSSLLVFASSYHGRLLAAGDRGLDIGNGFMWKDDRLDSDELILSDTVLLASIDGKFHALNRTSGRVKWTMHKPKSASGRDEEPPLYSLVRSQHGILEDDEIDSGADEKYIIEPQSGEVWVLPPGASQTTPLEKLAFTVPQLVDMSPSSLIVNGERRDFIGSKETSLITLNIDTGEVITIDDARSCVWSQEDSKQSTKAEDDDDDGTSLYDPFDEDTLEYAKNQAVPPPRTIIIGRTDYHLSVGINRRMQRLSFSVYGPNNIDRHYQERWIKPKDGRYLQPLPDGRVLSFYPKQDATQSFEWYMPFPKTTSVCLSSRPSVQIQLP